MADKSETVSMGPYEEQFTLTPETELAFGDYPKFHTGFRELVEVNNKIETFIDLVNFGFLPTGHMVMTNTQHQQAVSVMDTEAEKARAREAGWPEHGSVVYRQDPQPGFSRYIPDGELVTWGSSLPFLGDHFLRTQEGGLVLINSELKVGITVNGVVKLVKAVDHGKDFLDGTMPYVQDAVGGAVISADLGRM